MATNWPPYDFIQATKKPILYIGSYKLLFNRMCETADGDQTAYFYYINKVKHGNSCPSSAKAMVLEQEDGSRRFVLSTYNSNHSIDCVPNSAQVRVKTVKESIKAKRSWKIQQ